MCCDINVDIFEMDEFVKDQLQRPYKCANVLSMLEKLNKGQRVIFTKFGDGEIMCMKHITGQNCDHDTYSPELGDKLKDAFVTLCLRSAEDNIYIGRWHADDLNAFLLQLLYERGVHVCETPPFVHYHFVYPDHKFALDANMYCFVDCIQGCNRHKVVVSNSTNRRLETIFKGLSFIELPHNSWFVNGQYDTVKGHVSEMLNVYNDGIVLIAGGLASKVLINELSMEYKNASFIDIGSGFDILCQKRATRSWNEISGFPNSFENQKRYFGALLPDDF